MVREVKIVATFTTGTTVDDATEAEEQCTKMLLNKLKENHTADLTGAELFSVEIQSVTSESL